MSHFAVLVIMPEGVPLGGMPRNGARAATGEHIQQMHDTATDMLAPYDENGECFADNSRWDWWEVGGRWSGGLDNFDPYTLPQNWSRCDLCAGTGTRTLPVPGNPGWQPTPGECNGCGGTKNPQDPNRVGFRRNWSTAPYLGDYNTVAKALETRFVPYAVLTEEDGWIESGRMGWWGMPIPNEKGEEAKQPDAWEAEARAVMERYKDRACVLVDCHV